MNFIQQKLEVFQEIPQPVKIFAKRALLLFLVWKVCYLLILAPSRLIDAPLTEMVGSQTTWLLNRAHQERGFTATPMLVKTYFEGQVSESNVSTIKFGYKKVMYIADACNGLELLVLYIGFLIAMPANITRKLIYILGGTLIIHVLNVLRCTGLATIHIYINQYFDFAHHYLFKITLYGMIFILWIRFSQKLTFSTHAKPL